jgi:DNA-binding LacI/PurR family transcriptional regulator
VAAQQVLAALANDEWRPEQIVLPTELVVRRTTAPPAD